MFDVWHGNEVKTVYAVDRATNSCLVADYWGFFEWIPIDECRLYIPEEA